MKRKQMLISAVVLGLLLALAVGISQAQGPEPPEGEIQPQSEVAAAAVTPGAIPIQGRLTDDAGNPLDGTYNVTFSLYEQESGGSAICSDTRSVIVEDGLFSDYMDHCYNDLYGQKVWLGVEVESDGEMEPRQVIYSVPYALSLRPRAFISSTTSDAILDIENWHSSGRGLRAYAMAESGTNYGMVGSTRSADGYAGFFYNTKDGIAVVGLQSDDYSKGDYPAHWKSGGFFAGDYGVVGMNDESVRVGAGVYGHAESGHSYGVYGRSNSSSGRAGYFRNTDSGVGVYGRSDSGIAIKAGGTGVIQSTAKSYLWISGNDLRKKNSTDTTQFECDTYGGVKARRGADTGPKDVMLPVTLPGQLYGQDVTLTGIDVYFESETDFDGIGVTAVRRQTGAGSGDLIRWDGTDRVCESACSYHLDFTENNVLDDEHGPVYIGLQLFFSGSSTYVQIGGVRLTLEHD